MKDCVGNTLEVGDEIIAIVYGDLKKCTITRFTEKHAVINVHIGNKIISGLLQNQDKIYKIPEEMHPVRG